MQIALSVAALTIIALLLPGTAAWAGPDQRECGAVRWSASPDGVHHRGGGRVDRASKALSPLSSRARCLNRLP